MIKQCTAFITAVLLTAALNCEVFAVNKQVHTNTHISNTHHHTSCSTCTGDQYISQVTQKITKNKSLSKLINITIPIDIYTQKIPTTKKLTSHTPKPPLPDNFIRSVVLII